MVYEIGELYLDSNSGEIFRIKAFDNYMNAILVENIAKSTIMYYSLHYSNAILVKLSTLSDLEKLIYFVDFPIHPSYP